MSSLAEAPWWLIHEYAGGTDSFRPWVVHRKAKPVLTSCIPLWLNETVLATSLWFILLSSASVYVTLPKDIPSLIVLHLYKVGMAIIHGALTFAYCFKGGARALTMNDC